MNHGVNKTLKEFKDSGIILLNDGHSLASQNSREQTIDVTRTLIDTLLNKGYNLKILMNY